MTAAERARHEDERLLQLARACREWRLAFRRAWAKHERGQRAEADCILAEGLGRAADRLILAALATEQADPCHVVMGPKLRAVAGAKKKVE